MHYVKALVSHCSKDEGVYLFAAGSDPCNNEKSDDFGDLLASAAQEIDPKKRRFTTRLMRRSYISYWRGRHPESSLEVENAVLRAMHQQSGAIAKGYDKTGIRLPDAKNKAFAAAIADIELEDEDGNVTEEAIKAAAERQRLADEEENKPKTRGRKKKQTAAEAIAEDGKLVLEDRDAEMAPQLPPERKKVYIGKPTGKVWKLEKVVKPDGTISYRRIIPKKLKA